MPYAINKKRLIPIPAAVQGCWCSPTSLRRCKMSEELYPSVEARNIRSAAVVATAAVAAAASVAADGTAAATAAVAVRMTAGPAEAFSSAAAWGGYWDK